MIFFMKSKMKLLQMCNKLWPKFKLIILKSAKNNSVTALIKRIIFSPLILKILENANKLNFN